VVAPEHVFVFPSRKMVFDLTENVVLARITILPTLSEA